MLDEETAHAELDSISLVGGDALFPERLGNDAEHRAAVELLAAGLNRVNLQVADARRLDERLGARHAVVSRETGVGSAGALRVRRFAADMPRSCSRSVQLSHPRPERSSIIRSRQCAVASASPGGAVPARDVHAVVARDVIERATRQLRQNLARHLHRAESPPHELFAGGA